MCEQRRECRFANKDHKNVDLTQYSKIIIDTIEKTVPGKNPVVETIHAGLECGILGDKISNLDAVSIGPDMCDIHTPRERLSLSSFTRVWKFLLEVLKSM